VSSGRDSEFGERKKHCEADGEEAHRTFIRLNIESSSTGAQFEDAATRSWSWESVISAWLTTRMTRLSGG
jgi:hypothetical protein